MLWMWGREGGGGSRRTVRRLIAAAAADAVEENAVMQSCRLWWWDTRGAAAEDGVDAAAAAAAAAPVCFLIACLKNPRETNNAPYTLATHTHTAQMPVVLHREYSSSCRRQRVAAARGAAGLQRAQLQRPGQEYVRLWRRRLAEVQVEVDARMQVQCWGWSVKTERQ